MSLSKPLSRGYKTNLAFLRAFDVLLESGKSLIDLSPSQSVDFDIPKKDIYKAEKKLKVFHEKVKPFREYQSKSIDAKTKNILEDIILLSKEDTYISPELIAIHLLFEYFINTNHQKIHEDFSFFTKANNYYPILDRAHQSNNIKIKEVYLLCLKVIERSR